MREIDNKEMMVIDGGTNPVVIGSVIGVIVTFVVGLLHGFSNPKNCN